MGHPPARVALFDTSPAQLADLGEKILPAAYVRRLRAYRYGPGIFKMDWALDGPIPWRDPRCLEASTVHLGGTLGVSEAVIGLAQEGTFVGPNFGRHGDAWAEHLQCEYLPALELACLPALVAVLPPGYRDTCAKLERDSRGRIVMPPPDIAPSCS